MTPSPRLEVTLCGLQAMPLMRSFLQVSERSSTVGRQYTVAHTHIWTAITPTLAHSALSEFTRSSGCIQPRDGKHYGLTAHSPIALLDSTKLRVMLSSTTSLTFTRTMSISRSASGGLQEHRRFGTTESRSTMQAGIMKVLSRGTEQELLRWPRSRSSKQMLRHVGRPWVLLGPMTFGKHN